MSLPFFCFSVLRIICISRWPNFGCNSFQEMFVALRFSSIPTTMHYFSNNLSQSMFTNLSVAWWLSCQNLVGSKFTFTELRCLPSPRKCLHTEFTFCGHFYHKGHTGLKDDSVHTTFRLIRHSQQASSVHMRNMSKKLIFSNHDHKSH